jgi:hypothetical protein
VSTLYYAGVRKWDLEARGFATVDQVPDALLPHPIAARQKRAVLEDRLVVEPGLGAALRALEQPIAVLDLETVMPAIPVWPGCHPYDQVPVQFSCHVQEENGSWRHHEWIAAGGEDPRPALVRGLVEACRPARTILAYNASFERHGLEQIGLALPALREPVRDLTSRLQDALPLVRDHVYHVDFQGSFGLKAVLPALVPELGYAGLEIGDGMEASRVLESLLLRGEPADPTERERLRAGLRRYCGMDTWGVVRLLDRLRALAEAS